MDNLCHTLTGAAFGEAGLKHRTRYGSATLMIASNLPDIDVLIFLTDSTGFAFRRGWTHGILAQAALPVALAMLMWAIGRARRVDVRVGWLLALSYVGVLSHVLLDYLNNYGIRLLAPFDWTWFYGDAVFIADPVLWAILGVGVWLARRRHAPPVARGALLLATGYVAMALISTYVARGLVADAWRERRGREPARVMVGPVAVTPFTRVVIVDDGDSYEVGTFRWWDRSVVFEPMALPKNDRAPEVARARESSATVREFLVWARFPVWTLAPAPAGTQVTVFDVRFMSRSVNGAIFQASTVIKAPGAR